MINRSPNQQTAAQMASSLPQFPKELFKPAPAAQMDAEKISRPVVTYWQDAMRRLRKNRVAMVSLGVIICVGLVGLIGPFFFPAPVGGVSYENLQNTDFRSQDPTLGQKMLVVDAATSVPDDLIDANFDRTIVLPAEATIAAPADFKVMGTPTVDGITLTWKPVPGATGYRIYRTSAVESSASKAETDSALRGMAVGDVTDGAQYTYTDSMGLDTNDTYVYSVLTLVTDPNTGDERMSEQAATLSTEVYKTVLLDEARLQYPNAKVGETVRGRAYLFGTDSLGRDVLARTVQGTRVDFFLALVIPSITLFIGLVYGSLSALFGGFFDNVLMRIVEVLLSIPELLFLILLQVVMGKGMFSLIVALSAIGWLSYARVIRGEVLKLREIEFVHASKLLGASPARVIFKHIAPNLAGLTIVMWSAKIPGIIAAEAFLSFLGLGLEAPAASWGTVLYESAQRIQTNPLQFFLPAAVLGVTLLAFFLLGDALRDAFDPKLRGRD